MTKSMQTIVLPGGGSSAGEPRFNYSIRDGTVIPIGLSFHFVDSANLLPTDDQLDQLVDSLCDLNFPESEVKLEPNVSTRVRRIEAWY
jgi:hypothetical protein